MTLQDLEKHPHFGLLTAIEQKFIRSYLTTDRNMLSSLKMTFPNLKRHDLKARLLQKKPEISALLAYIDGVEQPDYEEIKKLLWKTVRNSQKESIIIRGTELLLGIVDGEKKTDEQIREERIKRMKEIDAKTTNNRS